jgi:hypothetical protein
MAGARHRQPESGARCRLRIEPTVGLAVLRTKRPWGAGTVTVWLLPIRNVLSDRHLYPAQNALRHPSRLFEGLGLGLCGYSSSNGYGRF